MGRILQNHFVVEERHLPPRDAKRIEVAPFMEHQAPKEILPVDDDM